jgi:hypothetical protein
MRTRFGDGGAISPLGEIAWPASMTETVIRSTGGNAMAFSDETAETDLRTSTTRRRVIGTGVKLAYAAPLVAATFKLGNLDASAQPVDVSPPEDDIGDADFE